VPRNTMLRGAPQAGQNLRSQQSIEVVNHVNVGHGDIAPVRPRPCRRLSIRSNTKRALTARAWGEVSARRITCCGSSDPSGNSPAPPPRRKSHALPPALCSERIQQRFVGRIDFGSYIGTSDRVEAIHQEFPRLQEFDINTVELAEAVERERLRRPQCYGAKRFPRLPSDAHMGFAYSKPAFQGTPTGSRTCSIVNPASAITPAE